MSPETNKPPYYLLNIVCCISGVLLILWFAIGVEKQNSSAQVIFEWLLGHSTSIIVAMIALMVLILLGSYFGMKAMKRSQRDDKVT